MKNEALIAFLENETSPAELSIVLNELLMDYLDTIIYQQLTDNEARKLHVDTLTFVHTIRRLRDVFAACR